MAKNYNIAAAAFWAILVLALTLSGCGFHLRGTAGGATVHRIPPTLVDGGSDQQLVAELQQELAAAGVAINQREQAEYLLSIDNIIQDRRVLSVGSGGRVEEYELYYRVTFTVRDPEGKEIIPTQTINTVREYGYSEQDVMAKQVEEERLFEDMRREVARTIVRRLQMQANTPPS